MSPQERARCYNLDRRKARICAALYPTRIKRGIISNKQLAELAKRFGISRQSFTAWENGDVLVHDDQIEEVEKWLEEGEIWKFVAIAKIERETHFDKLKTV